MEESILSPSPNWFQVSGMAVSRDGWLVYGGPSKSLCILEPLPPECNSVVAGDRAYKSHVYSRAHSEKIVSVSISPEWPEKKLFLAGSADGSVKQWGLEMENNKLEIKSTHCHDKHLNEKEEIVGVGYSTDVYAFTVGSFGMIVKWNLTSNVVKAYPHILKNFKPVCMSCSPHLSLHLAIGTNRGIIIVLDLTGPAKILYKVRGHDDEIVSLSWCPQYEVTVKKSLKQTNKVSIATQRLQKIRDESDNNQIEEIKTEAPVPLDVSGAQKTLPEDSFDESVVVEDDTFDIYKDHEADEFGHKKYQPEEIVVKIKEEEDKGNDFLAECMKLKEDILKRKDEPEPTIQSLVEAMDKTHVHECEKTDTESKEIAHGSSTLKNDLVTTDHIHKHLLATVSKFGAFRIWSKGGKLVGNCVLQNTSKNQKSKGPILPTLLWYKPNLLIISDGKSNIYECNTLQIDCTNKLESILLHSLHKRGAYCIVTDAPRVQTSSDGDWSIWSVAQDRNIIKYCMKKRQSVAVHATCGGYIYTIQSCPYDAGKFAVSVGDGAVRIWETGTLDDDETKLCPGQVFTYWQNVLGKVLSVAWHPSRENLLAFSTAEARVGLINTSGNSEKPARVLLPAFSGAVYALCWGENNDLYACSAGHLLVYKAHKLNEAPESIIVQVEGQHWEPSEVRWHPRGLLIGANNGGVAILTPVKPYVANAALFVYKKMIHFIEWHPQTVSNTNSESPYKDLIAVCGVDKDNNISILELKEKDDGEKELLLWKALSGHQSSVLRVSWNPHTEAQLLSSSRDDTVRVWDVVKGVCLSIFDGHTQTSIAIAWSPYPHLSTKVLSGGGDGTLRLWDINDYPADAYEGKHQGGFKGKRKLKYRKEVKKDSGNAEAEAPDVSEQQTAASQELRLRVSKKFLMPLSYRQMTTDKCHGVRKVLRKFLEKQGSDVKLDSDQSDRKYETDYIKIFGTINELNELLDMELQNHLRHGSVDSWIVLSLFRGHVDSVIQHAVQRDMLCPFLISMAPCVSSKYWKEVSQLYISQIDRLVAKAEEHKLCENGHFGGPIFRKMLTFLSIHDVKGAVATLLEARLFKEAYVLCRIRYMDSIAEEVLKKWAHEADVIGSFLSSAVCYAVQGDISSAATILAKSRNSESLRLAADLAKIVGHNTFAEHIIERMEEIKIEQTAESNDDDDDDDELTKLPSRVEALIAAGNRNGEEYNDSDSDDSE